MPTKPEAIYPTWEKGRVNKGILINPKNSPSFMKNLFPQNVSFISIKPITNEKEFGTRGEDITPTHFKTSAFSVRKVNRPQGKVGYFVTVNANDYEAPHEFGHGIQVAIHDAYGIPLTEGSLLDRMGERFLRINPRMNPPINRLANQAKQARKEITTSWKKKRSLFQTQESLFKLIPQNPEERFKMLGKIFKEKGRTLASIKEEKTGPDGKATHAALIDLINFIQKNHPKPLNNH